MRRLRKLVGWGQCPETGLSYLHFDECRAERVSLLNRFLMENLRKLCQPFSWQKPSVLSGCTVRSIPNRWQSQIPSDRQAESHASHMISDLRLLVSDILVLGQDWQDLQGIMHKSRCDTSFLRWLLGCLEKSMKSAKPVDPNIVLESRWKSIFLI